MKDKMKTICLLTAGMGTRMGAYSGVTNKCLLPVDNLAIISHIINQFPADSKFVVALGFKGDDVHAYLTTVHPNTHFEFATVDNYQGEGSGPGFSLQQCKPYLPESGFLLIACDAIYENLDTIPTITNYMAASLIDNTESSVAYLNLIIEDGKVISTIDKQQCDSKMVANGAWFIKDTIQFWADLSTGELSTGFKNLDFYTHIIPWIDLGTYEKYSNFKKQNGMYDFSKVEEILYFANGKVIKWFKDSRVSLGKFLRAEMQPAFPQTKMISNHLISHDFVPGKSMYEYKIDTDFFNKFIIHTQEKLWNTVHPNLTLSKEMLQSFYINKTIERLQKFEEKYPNFDPSIVNGVKMHKNMHQLMSDINWDAICNTDLHFRSRHIHGDLQFDNVIYDEVTDVFSFIDWRHEFGGQIGVGDVYYDIAKMIGGIHCNYLSIKKNDFVIYHTMNETNYYVQNSINEEVLKLANKTFGCYIIDALVGLIYLNMAPLHNPPFDKLLYCMALERLNKL